MSLHSPRRSQALCLTTSPDRAYQEGPTLRHQVSRTPLHLSSRHYAHLHFLLLSTDLPVLQPKPVRRAVQPLPDPVRLPDIEHADGAVRVRLTPALPA